MIDREHDCQLTKQAEALNISRGSVYYLPRPVSASDLEVMRLLDRLHLQFPFAGSRMLRRRLRIVRSRSVDPGTGDQSIVAKTNTDKKWLFPCQLTAWNGSSLKLYTIPCGTIMA